MATADYGTPTRPRHLCDPFGFNIVTKYASWYGDAYAHLGWQRDAFTVRVLTTQLSRRRPREDHRRLDLPFRARRRCAQWHRHLSRTSHR